MAYTEDDYDVTELGDLAEDVDNTCETCRGTGIGQYGDPDTSKCHGCGGRGVRYEADDSIGDIEYDRWRDEQDERERDLERS